MNTRCLKSLGSILAALAVASPALAEPGGFYAGIASTRLSTPVDVSALSADLAAAGFTQGAVSVTQGGGGGTLLVGGEVLPAGDYGLGWEADYLAGTMATFDTSGLATVGGVTASVSGKVELSAVSLSALGTLRAFDGAGAWFARLGLASAQAKETATLSASDGTAFSDASTTRSTPVVWGVGFDWHISPVWGIRWDLGGMAGVKDSDGGSNNVGMYRVGVLYRF